MITWSGEPVRFGIQIRYLDGKIWMVKMNIKPLDRIISAKDYGGSAMDYIKKQQRKIHMRGIPLNIEWKVQGKPVFARIWQGQWIADCEYCNGASFVDPDEPIFFCFGCANRVNGMHLRPVEFPSDWKEIEKVLLERPVDDVRGLTDNERAGMARPLLYLDRGNGEPLLPLTRSWIPGETIEELRAQQDNLIEQWKKGLRK